MIPLVTSFLLLLPMYAGQDSNSDLGNWNKTVEGGTVTIVGESGRHKQLKPVTGAPGTPISRSDTPARGGNLGGLRSLTLDEMCARNYGSNTGVAYYETWRMSGPLAEYCMYRENKDPQEASSNPAKSPAPQMTLADLGHYIRENAQVIIRGGKLTWQPASPEVIINKAVYFASSAGAYKDTVTVLGTPLELSFTPTTFEWFPGDGNTFVTKDAGGPYPNGSASYVYARPGTFTPGVRIKWNVAIRVIGTNNWYNVPGDAITSTTSMPITAVEAEAVLVANR